MAFKEKYESKLTDRSLLESVTEYETIVTRRSMVDEHGDGIVAHREPGALLP